MNDSLRPQSPPPPAKTAVKEAEKKVGAVLEDLEQDTGGEVKDIDLEHMVDTDPATGRPVIEKAVEIDLEHRHSRKWSR